MIGIFDAGVGGFSVLNALQVTLPGYHIGYLADTGRFPYSPRPLDEKLPFSLQDADFLVDQGAAAIVIACNAITCFAGEPIRRRVDVPVFDVISAGAEAAVKASRNKKIGVTGSVVTGNSSAYPNAVARVDDTVEVRLLPSQLMVYLVEEGCAKWPEVKPIIRRILTPMIESDIDTLVLGCTHFPFLIDAIKDAMGPDITIVDPGVAVAEQIKKAIASTSEGEQKNSNPTRPTFFVSGPVDRFIEIAAQYYGKVEPDQIVTLDWETILNTAHQNSADHKNEI